MMATKFFSPSAMPITAASEALASAKTKWGGQVAEGRLTPIGPAMANYLATLARNDAIPTAMRDGFPWFVAHVDPRYELAVAKAAPEQKLFGYCPIVQVDQRFGAPRLVNGVRTWRTRKADRALFPTYTLIQSDGRDDCQFRIKGIKHVQRLVTFAGYVAVLVDAEVQRIRRLEVNGYIPAREANVQGLDPGDLVRIVDGAFAGFMGNVVALAGKERITIELQMFGSLTPVETALHQVELVARKAESPIRR